MAPTRTTTLRLPVVLRDEIARLAAQRDSTLLEVVTDAVRRMQRDQWWSGVHEALDAMNPEELAEYRAETDQLDGTASDGLRGD
ncbi:MULTISPECIES: hypothetical protein [Candidatus Neomicrothrix]|uniref:hypothetical protein n=1 Tax=Candidatus Neomicrothrix TaxID=41949 RepID=UPI0012DDA4AA|nr:MULTISPECIES: hypothetical protein [Microthrix]NLH67769.1 hypothetical protein [Candidatus Microthrix parvicella]MBK6501688.1 hypothetical protein [Candidatus Microthrix sp.]MBK7321188.1 hypothetical protein [Candidatus Microthrix sp.]MBP6134465.1 hypothetical protein [Candidatus Microthrix sp.]MBP6149109.1 hypothetical protein [Candidatus Microthrix sp.]